jgi:flagellar motility protein MotE (MotC chaperone)
VKCLGRQEEKSHFLREVRSLQKCNNGGLVFRENIKDTMRDLYYIITPKTKSVAKDLDRVHEKLKKACSRKTL